MIRVCQLYASVTFSGVLWRVLIGPIPYLWVAALVGILKMAVSFILTLLNISHLMQVLMINNISTVTHFSDRTIKSAALSAGCVACAPQIIVTVMVRIFSFF